MAEERVYHLDLGRQDVGGARCAFLPGDPGRVPLIATTFDPRARELAFKREYRTWVGRLDGTPVLVTSTGIGGPSTSIAVEELARLGVKVFLRVGTTGAIQSEIRNGDIIITTGSVRLEGTSAHYAPIEYPAIGDHGLVSALVRAARDEGVKYWVGITASSATFYPGQERYDCFSGYVIRTLRGSLKEWEALRVLNYEMESSTLFVVCSVLGLRAGCVSGVIAERDEGEHVDRSKAQSTIETAVRVAVRAMRSIVAEDPSCTTS